MSSRAVENATFSLKLQSGRPEHLPEQHPELHVYLHPGCTYRLAVTIAWTELFGQVLATCTCTSVLSIIMYLYCTYAFIYMYR